MHPDNLKLVLYNMKDTTQTLMLFHQKILTDILLKNLKLTKLNKFVAILNKFG